MFLPKFGGIKSGIVRLNSFHSFLSSKQLYRNLSALTINNPESNTLFDKTLNKKCIQNCAIPFSTEQLTEPANPDVFGDIGGDHHEAMALDEDEEEQEKYEMDESRLPRRMRMSPGRYARLISDHIAKGDLFAAMNVLRLIKENGDKPTTYMYNLLIRGFAVQGKMKKCFKLYNDMKKRALPQNAATYVSIFNACANSSEREQALEIVNNVRDEMLRKNVPLNAVHYNVLIKAYGKHQCLLEAFQLVDEMIDKKMHHGTTTFNSLLFASISDESNGLRYALIVWHLMQQRGLKPTLMTFNLLLRAIRDTKLGNLKINDKLIESIPETEILLSDATYSDLLAKTPIVTPPVLKLLESPPPAQIKIESQEYKSSPAPSLVPTSRNIIAESNSTDEGLSKVSLNAIHKCNRLILFGGYNGFIARMEKSNVQPDAKTLTLLMTVAPPSLKIENDIINIARTKRIPLDIDFFNMLIKKRSSRHDYRNAKEVLNEIQLHDLTPNVITWGVLALGCTTHKDALALLEGMEATGHTLNPIIATTLLSNACAQNHFVYILHIINLMVENGVKPTELTFQVLDNFKKKMKDIISGRTESKHKNDQRYKEMFLKFNLRYDSWQKQCGRIQEDIKTNNRRH